ncbi:MAG: c-type cytochrome [Pirellulales bacterium]
MRTTTLLLAVVSSTAGAAEPTPPTQAIVPGFARFYDDAASDAVEGGNLLLGELQCLGCHASESGRAGWPAAKKAPLLEHVGQRVRPEFIREFLRDPQAVKPGTTMPSVLTGATAEERQRQAEALTHYLALSGVPQDSGAASSSVQRGEALYHQVGCTACHDPQREGTVPTADSVPHGRLSRKYTLPSLQKFLADPLAVRPSGRMPHLLLSADESRDIAAYLLRDLALTPNLRFEYFEGAWDKLPDFARLTAKTTGTSAGFAVNVGRSDQFALRFTGYVQIARPGVYQFHLGSDDGSRLLIDGREVVRMDGIHPLTFGSGRVELTAGPHRLEVEYFEQGGEEVLQVEVEGPGVPRQSLESLVTLEERPPPAAEARRFTVDPTLADEGRKLYLQLRCAACHAGPAAPANDMAVTEPPPLARLRNSAGCLASPPAGAVPRFALSPRQVTALRAAVTRAAEPASDPPAPEKTRQKSLEQTIERTLLTLHCYACHQRGSTGGVLPARQAGFQSTQPEMGDEGRLPPPLTGVGAKLRPEWLAQIVQQGGKDRPYMLTRMPRFGAANVGALADTLAQADPEPAYTKVAPAAAPGAFKAVGRRLVGSQGFSCIKCHTWSNVPATGIQAISMTTMTRRLREPWFHAYVLDPPSIRPGTRMPAAWPMGQTLLPGLLGGDTHQQIHSVWQYLLDGDQAAPPAGLGRNPIELFPLTAPIVYRNFIEGAGPRAIAVGYPSKIHLAFDAQELRLALLWQGAFIDAARHWTDRGVGYQPPLGDNVLKLPAGAEWAVLDNNESPWPTESVRTLGGHFRGYRLNAQREPIFLYDIGAFHIEDHPRPLSASDQGRLVRTLTITRRGGAGKLWFRAAVGESIQERDGAYQVAGQYVVKVTGTDPPPRIRQQGARWELLVPVTADTTPRTLVQEIVW